MKNFLRKLWDKEETRIILAVAVALVLSALLFVWGMGSQTIQSDGKLQGDAFRYDYNW